MEEQTQIPILSQDMTLGKFFYRQPRPGEQHDGDFWIQPQPNGVELRMLIQRYCLIARDWINWATYLTVTDRDTGYPEWAPRFTEGYTPEPGDPPALDDPLTGTLRLWHPLYLDEHHLKPYPRAEDGDIHYSGGELFRYHQPIQKWANWGYRINKTEPYETIYHPDITDRLYPTNP